MSHFYYNFKSEKTYCTLCLYKQKIQCDQCDHLTGHENKNGCDIDIGLIYSRRKFN